MDAQLILLGAALAAAYVALTEWVGGKARTPVYGVGLVVAGGILATSVPLRHPR